MKRKSIVWIVIYILSLVICFLLGYFFVKSKLPEKRESINLSACEITDRAIDREMALADGAHLETTVYEVTNCDLIAT